MANNIQRPAAPGAHLHLHVPADPRLGGYVRQEIMAFAATERITDADITDFVAAIGEAFANAIEHAHTVEPIEISAWMLGDDRLFASVQDHGIGFNSTERAMSARLPDGFQERGRGLPIMQRCTDVFSVRSAPGRGTCVTLGCYVQRAYGQHLHNRAG